MEIRVTDVENCGYQGGKGRGINWEIGTDIHTLLLLLLLLHRFSRVRLCATLGTAARQAPHPWGSPGKNTGVGCQFLLHIHYTRSIKSFSSTTKKNPFFL